MPKHTTNRGIMKTITMTGPNPGCDLCRILDKIDTPVDAIGDYPTWYGSWGYLCQKHYDTHAASGTVGTHITWLAENMEGAATTD